MILNLSNTFTEILNVSKSKNKYFINSKFNYEKGLDYISDNEKYVKELIEFIKENVKERINNIYFIMQNDEIIIRNMDNINPKKKKDTIPLIKYEINKYMPIDLQNYIIKYKKIKDFDNKEYIQSILFPKKFVHICNEISKELGIKKSYLHVNFDILQKLININLISLEQNKSVIIENRLEDMIVNRICNNTIVESYIVNKQNDIDFTKSLDKESIYYYGIEDEYIKELDIKKINIKKKIGLIANGDKISEIDNYINIWGMIS